MIRLKESLALFISIITTNVTMDVVLQNNLNKGLYPIDADSIGIPIVSGIISSGLLLILMIPAIFIPQTRKLFIWIQITLLTIGGTFAGLNGISWVLPNHYLIAISYLLVIVTGIWLIVRRSEKLSSFKPS